MSMVIVYQVKFQTTVYSYQTNALVATTLVIGLTVYMYTICHNYLSSLIDDELNDKSSFAAAQTKRSTVEIVRKIKQNQKEIIEIKKRQMNIATSSKYGIHAVLTVQSHPEILEIISKQDERITK